SGGGDIRVAVGGDIDGAGSTQLATDWLATIGGERISLLGVDSPAPTVWTVRYDRFRQSLGTLGGGDISITAAGSANNLSVMLPTTGRPDGDGIHYSPFEGIFSSRGTPGTTVLGGGDLDLQVGGDLLGARLLVVRGAGRVRAGGRIAAAGDSPLDTLLLLGEATLDMAAAGDITLETVANFSMVRRPLLTVLRDGLTNTSLNANTRSYFFTYGAGSGLELTSLGGDVTFENRTRDTDPLFTTLLGSSGVNVSDVAAMRTYPGSLSARALSGDIVILNRFQLFPDAGGNLELLAQNDIADLGLQADAQRVVIVQSDADPALLPSSAAPASGTPGLGARFEVGKRRPLNDLGWHAERPVHLDDRIPSLLVARDGTIGQARAESRGFRLFLAESGRIVAGRDVINLDFEIQHLRADDASLVAAGRDFRFTPNRDTAGNLSQSLQDRFQGALFSGPGRGIILAGRNIDLGTSDGIVSVGNLRNFALPDDGADVQVFVGAGAGPDLVGFYRTHIAALPDNEAEGISYLQETFGSVLATDEAREMHGQLAATRRALRLAGIDVDVERKAIDLTSDLAGVLLATFFDELEFSGISATTSGSDNYARGFAAIETLFPQPDLAGSLSMLLSRIHTEDGGDINLFVPGGSANIGAAATSSVTKAENELGIVAQATGDVRGFVRDDFFVNAARVFALFGGEILLWASEGDIDAGRGAKTALAAPPPQVVFNPSTNQFETVFPPEISGSGIRNFAPPSVTPGDVFLFAPQGVISAGDAGIASAGNITIGAREVIGADNIDVGGTAIGVPQADIGVAAGLSGAAGVANAASRGAQDSASEQAGSAASTANAFEQPMLSIISVEVLGFGG
ncbi:MAG: filamentous hemagglutinin family protein, partial [Gammaproteobacteria bacterium]